MEGRPFESPSRARRYALPAGATLVGCLAALASPITVAPVGATARVHAAATEACPPPAAPAPPAGVGSPPAPAPSIPVAAEVVLACVGDVPITGATFDHWATVASKSSEPEHSGAQHSKGPTLPVRDAITEVMGFLISSDWVIGEASRLGISLSEATVKRRYDHIRAQQFPHRREFRKFLRSSGQTIADLLMRVRLNMLSGAIQRHVAASAKGAKAKQRALSEFIKGFKARWQAQTECVPAFLVPDCGSAQEPL